VSLDSLLCLGHGTVCLLRRRLYADGGTFANSGIWAPALRFHDGVFYVVTTLVNDDLSQTDPSRWDNVSRPFPRSPITIVGKLFWLMIRPDGLQRLEPLRRGFLVDPRAFQLYWLRPVAVLGHGREVVHFRRTCLAGQVWLTRVQ
jgi:hypothetical protein